MTDRSDSSYLDTVVQAAISVPGEVDRYSFAGRAGRTVTVSAFWGQIRGFDAPSVQLRLYGPDGKLLADAARLQVFDHLDGADPIDDFFSRIDELALPLDGTYFVEVAFPGQRTGGYALGISDPLAHPAPLSTSAPTHAAFGVRGDTQEWSFAAAAGQALGWTYQGAHAIQGWTITGPGGFRASNLVGNESTIVFTPPVTGTYELSFQDVKDTPIRSTADVGPFSYTLSPAVAAPLDRRVDASISAPLQADLYAVAGRAGGVLTVSAFWGHGDAFSFNEGRLISGGQIRVFGSNGTLLAAPANVGTNPGYDRGNGSEFFTILDAFPLAADGTYFVEVTGSGRTGPYSLGIADPLPRYAALSSAQPTQAAFGVRGDEQDYQFTATAGQALGWTYRGGRPMQGWSVAGPGGMVVASGTGGTTVTIAFTPPATGTYLLSFRDTLGDGPVTAAGVGPFAYTLSPSVAVPLDRRIDASIAAPLQADLYAVAGRAGAVLTVSAYWGTNDLPLGDHGDNGVAAQGRFRIFGPDGTLLASPPNIATNPGYDRLNPSSFYSEKVYALPEDGTYFVEVSDTAGLTGNYWLGIADPISHIVTLSSAQPTPTFFGVDGDEQDYQFDAMAGRALGWDYLSTHAIQGWSVTGPGGMVVASGTGGTTVTIAFTPPATGTYLLSFRDVASVPISASAVGPFAYTLSPAVSAPLDRRIDASIAAPLQADLYAVAGRAGTVLTVSAFWGRGYAPGLLLDAGHIRVFGPDGSLLAAPPNVATNPGYAGNNPSDFFTALDAFPLTADGTYFVEVTGSGQTGAYWLGIADPLPRYAALSSAQPTQAAFGVRGDEQDYQFSASAGQALGWTYRGDRPMQGWTVTGPGGFRASGPGGATATIAFTAPAAGTYLLSFRDAPGNAPVPAAGVGPFAYTLYVMPSVQSVVINDGSAQRSMVTSITITFSTLVTLDPGAFELTEKGKGSIALQATYSVVNGETQAVLRFAGAGIIGGSLEDGNYTLTIHADHVHEVASPNQALSADRVDSFFRFFGDTDGDRDVDNLDYFKLRSAYGLSSTQSGYLWYFDFNGDGKIDATDLAEFNKRRNKQLNP